MADSHMTKNNNKHKLEWWAVIASSLAAVISMILLFYQIWTDNPQLDINLKGVAFADCEQDAYFAVWITAFNKGKRPIGVMESSLDLNWAKGGDLSIKEIPLFPRFSIQKETKSPTIERPFFYDPTYQDSFVKDETGKPIPFDWATKELDYRNIILDTGGYHFGYIIFQLNEQERNKFMNLKIPSSLTLKLTTTEGIRCVPIKTYNNWKKETFYKRFFVIRKIIPDAAEPSKR